MESTLWLYISTCPLLSFTSLQWNFKGRINCLSKIILVYGFGQKNKINYDNYGLINLPVDGVFFKEHLTTKWKQITVTCKCVFGISLEQLKTLFRSNLAC